MKRIRGGAPLRLIASRRSTFHGPGGRERISLSLQCGHVLDVPKSRKPKRRIACDRCGEVERERIEKIKATLDPNRAPYSLAFRLDGLPTGQAHRHPIVVARERKQWHRAVWFTVRLKLPPFPLPLVRATFTRHSAATIDPTNNAWSFKAIEDGLVEAGVLADDGPENYVGGFPDCGWKKAPQGRGFITIEIEERFENGEEEVDPQYHLEG